MLETVSEIAQIWDKSLKRIAARLDDSGIYDMLFDQSYIDSIDGANITVVLNSGLGVTLMEKNEKYRALVENAVAETTGSNYSLRFVQKSETKKVPDLPPKQDKNAFFTEAHLNPKYVFENFVQGPSNREAYQAAFMISRNPGQLFNPLLLHSNSGLGKTHLLHALGNAIKEKNPNARVLCVSADEFVDEYVKFAQGYKDDQSLVQYFKHDVDVFLVDDVQFLAKKEKTMEMFFTIFCYLYSAGKQIVITSDQSPVTIDGLDDRLKTRFAQGLVLEIKKPDLATSKEILRMKIRSNGLDVNDFDEDVIEFLASRFSDNIRELEGALNRLLFYTINIRPSKHITMAVASEAISSLVSATDGRDKLTESKVISTVADYYGLSAAQLTGKIRTAQIALARHISMYLIRELLGTPYIRIGEIFGGKDHATVMNGVKKVSNSLKVDPDLQKAISDLRGRLKK